MLVEMARRGEIDPWNIDVVEIADRFLQELERAQKLDLRISGRVLLYAAILVRMKAEVLADEVLGVKEEAEEELIPDEVEFGEFFDDFDSTFSDFDSPAFDYDLAEIEENDELISFLLTPHRKVRRFTTLKDLIDELKRAEEVHKRRKKKKKRAERRVDTSAILETPHEENIEETIAMVEEELMRLFRRKQILYFSELVRGKEKGDVLSYYLSVLHLTFRKKLEIEQQRIYEDDIEIRQARG
ncbi:segregation/condensation protein A [Archaeoglobus veneficus]|uniref:Chromosome segregation and condensation protein ScpA n=1 Tax=Archaeoglobus veneficus (strain DSM 11195 / SNP6) TaxID=693661 RepID=F2KNS4_ARCVS|nr:ScpA family protein [Archaeoglobus veneficus]AEA47401.1 chromosome segregation and condensation protein ScpA [Archaeoglobus veneficus SNP6]